MRKIILDDSYIRNNSLKVKECWIWQGSLNKGVYGTRRIKGRTRLMHRVSYEIYNGNIPEGMNVLHYCDVPSCINPDHLFIGTQKDNMQDCAQKGRHGPPRYKKISNNVITEIFNSKGTYRDIANKFSVGRQTVCNIKNSKPPYNRVIEDSYGC